MLDCRRAERSLEYGADIRARARSDRRAQGTPDAGRSARWRSVGEYHGKSRDVDGRHGRHSHRNGGRDDCAESANDACWPFVQLFICTVSRAMSCSRLSASIRWLRPICCAEFRMPSATRNNRQRRISYAGSAEPPPANCAAYLETGRRIVFPPPQNAEPHREFPSP